MSCTHFYIVVDISDYGIQSPVNNPELRQALQGYSEAEFIINGFEKGFPLGVKRDYVLKYQNPKPRPSPLPLLNKLRDEVAKGRIIGPFDGKPFNDLFISPLYVIPKPNSDKFRMIFNLSHPVSGSVNDNIPDCYRSVHYCSVQDVGQCILSKYGEHGWMAKVDLADAYRIVPIQKTDWKFLGIFIEDQYYIDRMLPMGASSSCQLFMKISNSLRWMFYKQNLLQVDVFNYLDDFLFISNSQSHCEQALVAFENLCGRIGVPIAGHKTVRPTKSLVFLGIGIDATSLSLFIPADKKQVMFHKLKKFLSTRAPTVKAWQSLAGSLNHIAQVLVSGRIYLSSIYERLSGILAQQQNKRRTISSEVTEDLQIWFDLIRLGPPRPFKLFDSASSACADIYTDASTSVGYGGVWGTDWFFGPWPCGKKCNIAVLELYPIYIALSMVAEKFSDTAINIYTDNWALVSVLNRLYCKDRSLRIIMREIVQLCLRNNFHIIARHIRGEQNIGPDMLSRGKIGQFLQSFPLLKKAPTRIPSRLEPQNNDLIQWVKNFPALTVSTTISS